MASESFDFLNRVLDGETLLASDIDALISHRIVEDQFIDYKHGNELQKKEAGETVRKYVSGYANALGGVIVIGVDAPSSIPTFVTGCAGHAKGNLAEWATRSLTKMTGQLVPAPRIQVVTHANGEILVIATPRSANLVSYTDGDRVVYAFRLHDQTIRAPEYLMADMLLGRRQQPSINVVACQGVALSREHDSAVGAMDLGMHLRMQFENSSLVWADKCKWGLVAWVQTPQARASQEMSDPTLNLRTYLDIRDPGFFPSRPPKLVHIRSDLNIEQPFDTDSRTATLTMPLRINNDWATYLWRGALYVVAKNSSPTWFQMSFPVNVATVSLIDAGKQLDVGPKALTIEKLGDTRPVVEWLPIGEDGSATAA